MNGKKSQAIIGRKAMDYPDGFSVPLYAYRDRRYSEAVVGYLRKVGITADLRFLQWTALRPIVQQEGKAAMAQLTWGSQGILGPRSVLDIGTRSVPLDDVCVLVA